ncbi:plasmid replication/partition related protein [Dyella silvae]|uniref:plasmid replication/partition related protein n=1 Tax=Dyella silvae TaxID=2994424 RepID=UPI002264470F|nr:plasmid replication/partition related protein [Dyella silvae]
MDIVVNEELKAYIDPLTPDEHEALERSLLAEGCRDALVLWGNILVDGHNRYGICQKHDLPYQTVQNTRFQSMEDVHLWMIEQHLGRRSVSDFQRGVLALRKREILSARRQSRDVVEPVPAPPEEEAAPEATEPVADAPAAKPRSEPLPSRQALAREARLSNSQVVMIEKIHKQAAPEVVAAVKSGALSINAAAAVASLPEEEQRAAAVAGGDELKQAAKRVRESRRKPPKEQDPANEDDLPTLRKRVAQLTAEVAELTAENEALKQQLARWQKPED